MATAQKKKKKTKASAPAASRGLDARRLASAAPPGAVEALSRAIVADGGSVLAAYRDPLGGHWQLLAGLPIDRVEPTPYQRDLSEAHVGRVANAIDKLDRYLDPVIAVPAGDGKYWSPNGYHRLGAMRALGAKSIVALVVPEPEVAHRILLLNTEKAHNLRERALEVARLAEALSELDDRPEREFETEFEEAALITLGLCYQQNGRFSGGAYHPVLKRCDKFLGSKLPTALATRRERAAKLLELNELVNEAVKSMKSRGLESPYLKAFVVARINPLRFQRKPTADFDETIDKMLGSARRFDATKVKADQVARSGGAPSTEE
jgi:ParB family chromosome partitioning protein